MSRRNHRVSNSPDSQHRNVQPCQGIAQIDELLSIIESGIGSCHQRFVRAGLHALLVELVYQFLLNHTSMSEEVCEFHAYVLRAGLGMYQLEHRAINLRPQARAIDQYQSFYPLRIASGEGKSHCSSERVATEARARSFRQVPSQRLLSGQRQVPAPAFAPLAKHSLVRRCYSVL